MNSRSKNKKQKNQLKKQNQENDIFLNQIISY